MNKPLLVMLVALLFAVSACRQASPGPVAPGDVVQSGTPRDISPAVDKTDTAALVDGNNAFAFSLYQALRGQRGNLFYSPYSISQALAMTYAGARGNTEKSMAEALEFTLSPDRLHPAFNGLDLQLKQRGQGARGKDGEPFRLRVVNAIWSQKDYKFLQPFLDTLAREYGAGLRLMDFVNDAEQARADINRWVGEQTKGKIKDLIPPGAVNALTRLVLTNAIYFNASWLHPFDKGATSDGQFRVLDGSQITVPMMRQTESLGYADGGSYQALELPYSGQELSLVLLLPNSGQFESLERSLDGALVKSVTGKLAKRRIALTMPRFEYESSFGLKEALTGLGMGVAFTEDADFSGMNGGRDLVVQDVLHKAFVAVDESGTEAAAATAVIIGVTSAPAEPLEVNVDRPFIFLIRDIPTGSIVFVGRVLNPAAK